MDDELAFFYVHTVSVQTRQGAGPNGDIFSAPTPVLCWVDEVQKLVRDTTSGEEVVSSTTVSAPLVQAATFALGSLVTLPSGRVARVLAVSRFDAGSLDSLDHIEASLT